MSKKISKIIILLFVAIVGAIYGAGYSYHSFITPLSSHGELRKVSADRWLQDGSKIILKNLSERGNFIKISFNPWRPPGPAVIKATVCGEEASIITVEDDSEHTIYLTGKCGPRLVSFKVENPFTPSESDQRLLGAQINYIKVSSKLRVPLVKLEILARISFALFALSLLMFFLTNGSIIAPLLATISGAYLIAISKNLSLTQPFSLWLFLIAIISGALTYSYLKKDTIKDSSNKKVTLLVLAIIGIGAALRFYGIDFGLPFNYHPDEVPKFNAIQRMRAHGDLNPRYFLHPTLLLYSTYLFNNIFTFLTGATDWPASLIQSGRIMSATAGILSIALTFGIGRSLFNERVALIGALILAIAPLHITSSRYVKEDALLTFFILLATYLTVKSAEDNKRSLLLLGGIAAGAAASTKYSGILAGFILLGAPWLRSKSYIPDFKFITPTIAACIMVPLGFVLFSPYTLLDYQKFLADFNSEREHMVRGHMVTIDAWSQFWMYHFYRSIIPGLTYLTALLSITGVGILLARRKITDLYLIALILLFYLPAEFVKAKPAPQPERYILPCLPFLALAVGIFFDQIRSLPRAVRVSLLTIVVLSTLYRSITLTSEITNDTRETMRLWMLENIPRGSKIVVDWRPYNPQFNDDEFTIIYLPREDIIAHLRVSQLKKNEGEYLLLSGLYYRRFFDQPNSNPAFRDIFRDVFKSFPEVKKVSPRYGTYGFHNPEITLLKLK